MVGLVVAAYFSNRLLDSMMCERPLMNKTQRVVLLSVNLIRWVSEWTGDGKTSSWSLTLLAQAIFETTAQILFWRENLPFYIGKRKQKQPHDQSPHPQTVKMFSKRKGAQDLGLRISTLVQFRKLWSHWRKNDGSNLGSHWWKYCQRICAKLSILSIQITRRWENGAL